MSQSIDLIESMGFFEFFDHLKSTYLCYHSKVISKKFNIPSNLQNNIDNYGHFIDTFEALIKNKLYLWVTKGYSVFKMFHKYILPTTVFLHYLNVDISKIPEIQIFVVDNQTYEIYKREIGGEYSDRFKTNKSDRMHLILIKDYKTERITYKDLSLTSLFHELMHLVDNLGFDGLQNSHNIDYMYRCHEIKARYISEAFLRVYKGLKSNFSEYRKNLIISTYLYMQRDSLDELEQALENITSFNNKTINLELDSEFRSSQLICEFTHKNQSYYRSLKCINQLNQIFDKLESVTIK